MDIDNLNKRYYTISEVAKMFKVKTSLIRFWENEFDSLKPHKTGKGDRRFTPENIRQFQQIYHLVKERGFTLSGAKQEIQHLKNWNKKKEHLISTLQDFKNFLTELQKEF
jgi:DNA-binding transcriptional MerR regulator